MNTHSLKQIKMKNLIILSAVMLFAGHAAFSQLKISTNMVLGSNTVMFVDGDIHIDEGELRLEAGSTLKLSDEKNLLVNDGGMISIAGSDTEEVLITSAGYFAFIVNTGGAISADHAIFEKMSGNGLTIQPGATIDTDNPLHNSVFQSGAAGATMLTVNNNQVLTIEGVVFIQTDSEAYNVAKTVDVGEVTFTDFSGNFAGEAFENDDFNRIHWGEGIPANQVVQNITVTPGTSLCFDALQTITVEDLLVQNGGSINLIAGQNIILLPGVIVESGGVMHAFISTGGVWCNPSPMMASLEAEDMPAAEIPQEIIRERVPLQAYPNPTTGIFTLEVPRTGDEPVLIIEVYSMLGENILRTELPAETHYTLDLTGRQPGMYIVRVIRGQEMDFVKVLKR